MLSDAASTEAPGAASAYVAPVPARRRITSACSRPFEATTGPAACQRAALGVRETAARLLDDRDERGDVPRVQVDALEHHLGGALGEQAEAPEVARRAHAPGVAEQRPCPRPAIEG